MQSFGDFLGFNPHTHTLVFMVMATCSASPPLELKKLEALFRHKVFRMLSDKGKITREMTAMLSTWRHSGFSIFCGNRISPDDDTASPRRSLFILSLARPYLPLVLMKRRKLFSLGDDRCDEKQHRNDEKSKGDGAGDKYREVPARHDQRAA